MRQFQLEILLLTASFAQGPSWQEDDRRVSNGDQVSRAAAAMKGDIGHGSGSEIHLANPSSSRTLEVADYHPQLGHIGFIYLEALRNVRDDSFASACQPAGTSGLPQ
jgi:hypothetical protein